MTVDAARRSDPAMVLVPPKNKYTKDITFFAGDVNDGGTVTNARNYLTVVAKNVDEYTITLDGTSIGQYAVKL